MSRSPLPCPSCGSRTRRWGRIPPSARFAGRVVDTPLPTRWRYACRSCGLRFTAPRPSAAELAELYAAGTTDNWTVGAFERADWNLAAGWLADAPAGTTVLDVGCFEGEFLGLLPDTVEKFGVEVQADAAQRAAALRGVSIIGAEYQDLEHEQRRFDVVTCFDVIEHVHDPRHLLQFLADRVKPGGQVIVGTGNADSPMWRVMGARYWYSWYPEHISFVSPAWCRQAAPGLGLAVERVELISRSFGHSTVARETLNNLVYRVLPLAASGALKRRLSNNPESDGLGPPPWVAGKDHFVVAFAKPGGGSP